MIDEKKIDEAARKYALNKYESTDDEVVDIYTEELQMAFEAGINWFLDNLWRDARKKPERDGLLFPGDLVKINYSVFEEECEDIFQVRVSSLEDTFVLRKVGSQNPFAVSEKQIRRIPLTPEILEKNGWNTQNGWFYYLDVRKGFLSCIDIDFQHKSGSGKLLVKVNNESMLEIEYVHQLQHLLFGLGLSMDLKM